jgi:hypothetical protein
MGPHSSYTLSGMVLETPTHPPQVGSIPTNIIYSTLLLSVLGMAFTQCMKTSGGWQTT